MIAETRRRSVFKVASVYCVTAWGASLGASSLLPAFGAPAWAVPLFVSIAALGLPIAIALAWAYEISPTERGRIPMQLPRAQVGAARQIVSSQSPENSPTMFLSAPSDVTVRWTDIRGPHEQRFTRSFRIGRDPGCEVQFDDPMISRHHAEIILLQGIWWINDLGSRNGTTLDGRRITRAALPGSCEVQLYERGAVIHLQTHSAPDTPTAAASVLSAMPDGSPKRGPD